MALNWNEEQTRRRMLAVPVAYFFFYLLYFTLLQEYARPKFWVYTELDAYIPFFEGFVIPYVLWFPLVPLMFLYFHRRDPESYVYLCRTILTGLTLCLLIYTVLPNGQLLRRPLPRDNILCQLVALIRKTDPPINVCPSIHVFVSATIGIAAARAGLAGREIDAAGRTVIQAAGYGEAFSHSFGHSLGLEIHESPNAAPGEERIMPVGAVVSAEPGIYLPGRFGVRIEDVIVLSETGCRDLTKSPKELIVL